MKPLQDTLIDIATPASYDTVARGGDIYSEMVDRAIKLQKKAKDIKDQLAPIKEAIRNLCAETGIGSIKANHGIAIVGHVGPDGDAFTNDKNKLVYPACRLDNETVEDLLQEFEDKALITKNKHTRCFISSERAVPVTFKPYK